MGIKVLTPYYYIFTCTIHHNWACRRVISAFLRPCHDKCFDRLMPTSMRYRKHIVVDSSAGSNLCDLRLPTISTLLVRCSQYSGRSAVKCLSALACQVFFAYCPLFHPRPTISVSRSACRKLTGTMDLSSIDEAARLGMSYTPAGIVF